MDGMGDYGAEEVWAAEEDRRYWEEQARDIIERLREAARVLRERAEAAEAVIGTGWYTPSMLREMTVEAEVAPFINAMHPGVGLALANWLDAQADTTCDCGVDEFALAVANLILGTARNVDSASPF